MAAPRQKQSTLAFHPVVWPLRNTNSYSVVELVWLLFFPKRKLYVYKCRQKQINYALRRLMCKTSCEDLSLWWCMFNLVQFFLSLIEELFCILWIVLMTVDFWQLWGHSKQNKPVCIGVFKIYYSLSDGIWWLRIATVYNGILWHMSTLRDKQHEE